MDGLPRPLRVSIEGNIGSGKSTCLNYFKQFDFIDIHPEPLDEWRNVDGHNLLGLLYSDLNKWNFPFQNYCYLSRLRLQTGPPSSDNIKVKLFERSLQNVRFCFIEHAYKNHHLLEPEYKILTKWYDFTSKHIDINIDLIVYLKTTPETVWERMKKRARKEEAKVPLDYLKEIHDSHEQWLNNPDNVPCEVMTIDADQDLKIVLEEIASVSDKMFNMIQYYH